MGDHRLNVLVTWVVRAPGCLDGYGRKHGRRVPEGDGKEVTDKLILLCNHPQSHDCGNCSRPLKMTMNAILAALFRCAVIAW